MLSFSPTIQIERKSVFLINFFLIILMILTFLFSFPIKYFFYTTILVTFFFSFYFFKKSRQLAKTVILTNLFIFFYFLYPKIANFLTQLMGTSSYMFILLYSLFLAYIFLAFSGNVNTFVGSLKKFSLKFLGIIVLFGILLGFFFFIVKEPIPFYFIKVSEAFSLLTFLKLSVFSSLLIAASEQMIFSGFLYNSYSKLTSKKDAMYQTATIFVSFHLLRFEVLVKHYFVQFNDYYLFYLVGYYLLLFLFMIISLKLYSFKSKKYEGNIFYPIVLHFITDLTLFMMYML